jgi:hypothetical protein
MLTLIANFAPYGLSSFSLGRYTGVPYRLRISPLGRVWLVWMPADLTRSDAAPAALLTPAFAFTTGRDTGALRRALRPEATPCPPAPLRRIRTIPVPAGLRLVHGPMLDTS